jgi:hypothetical protein
MFSTCEGRSASVFTAPPKASSVSTSTTSPGAIRRTGVE